MAIIVSEEQLEALENPSRSVVVVHDKRTKKGYAVMPERVYDRARPLIDFVAAHVATTADGPAELWTDGVTDRRDFIYP